MDSLDISIIRDTRTGKYAKVPKGVSLKLSCVFIDDQDLTYLQVCILCQQLPSLICYQMIPYSGHEEFNKNKNADGNQSAAIASVFAAAGPISKSEPYCVIP